MIRNLYLTLAEQGNSQPKQQQANNDDFIKVVLNNSMVLNNLLFEQGGICVIANTTCGT